jgi:hypothetical protein
MSYDEYMNPYYGTCSKHGAWHGSYDECPQCMKEEAYHEYDHVVCSICWNCQFGSEPDSKVFCGFHPKMRKLAQIPRKKKCKHFKECIPPSPDEAEYFAELNEYYHASMNDDGEN